MTKLTELDELAKLRKQLDDALCRMADDANKYSSQIAGLTLERNQLLAKSVEQRHEIHKLRGQLQELMNKLSIYERKSHR